MTSIAYVISPARRNKERANLTEANPEPENYGLSMLGTPVYSYIRLKSVEREIYLSEVILVVAQQKHIVKTPLVGRNGTVKEIINEGDYAISIEAKLVGPKNALDRGQIANLIELLKTNEALEVESPFLQLFDITDIVVEDYYLPEGGNLNEQPFRISAISDEPYELILTDNGA